MSEDVIEAYDKALNELIWIQYQVEKALAKTRESLLDARREALKKESKP